MWPRSSSLAFIGKHYATYLSASLRRRAILGVKMDDQQPTEQSTMPVTPSPNGRHKKLATGFTVESLRKMLRYPYNARRALKIPPTHASDITTKVEALESSPVKLAELIKQFGTEPSHNTPIPLMFVDLTFASSLQEMDFSHYPSLDNFGVDVSEFYALQKIDISNLSEVMTSYNFPWHEQGALYWQVEGFFLLVHALKTRPRGEDLERVLQIEENAIAK